MSYTKISNNVFAGEKIVEYNYNELLHRKESLEKQLLEIDCLILEAGKLGIKKRDDFNPLNP